MFNVIPPINGRNVGFAPQKNKFASSTNNLAPMKSDTVSFSGVKPVKFSDVYLDRMTHSMYLSKNSLTNSLKDTNPKMVMSVISDKVGELFAKRMDYLGYTRKTEFGSYTLAEHDDFSKTLSFHEKGEHRNKFVVDWTKQFNEIKKVVNTENYEFNAVKENLYEVLKKHNLMK